MPDLEPAALVEGVRKGDHAAKEQLYESLRRDQMFYLLKQVGSQAEDILHELWLLVIGAIEGGRIEHPENVFSYAHGAARRLCARQIARNLQARPPRRERMAAAA